MSGSGGRDICSCVCERVCDSGVRFHKCRAGATVCYYAFTNWNLLVHVYAGVGGVDHKH
jgi:hypothetical protein